MVAIVPGRILKALGWLLIPTLALVVWFVPDPGFSCTQLYTGLWENLCRACQSRLDNYSRRVPFDMPGEHTTFKEIYCYGKFIHKPVRPHRLYFLASARRMIIPGPNTPAYEAEWPYSEEDFNDNFRIEWQKLVSKMSPSYLIIVPTEKAIIERLINDKF